MSDPTADPEIVVPESDHHQENEDLAASLTALAQLSSERSSLTEVLVKVALLAVQAIPGAEGAGLTLQEPDRADLVVKTHEFVRTVDDIQYALGEGPCISAAANAIVVRSGQLGKDPRWRRFGPRVARLGVNSVISLPLIAPTGVVGAMNVYAHARDVFDDRAEVLGQIYATPAAISVHNAHVLAQAERLTARLRTAVEHRHVIDQAIGVLRSRNGLTADEAFTRLREISQNEHVKLFSVAESIVTEAVRRARARHSPH